MRYRRTSSHLTISTQPQTQISNQNNINNDTPTELIDPMNRRVTVTDANTSAATAGATFDAPQCGGGAVTSATARDQLYRFVPTHERAGPHLDQLPADELRSGGRALRRQQQRACRCSWPTWR